MLVVLVVWRPLLAHPVRVVTQGEPDEVDEAIDEHHGHDVVISKLEAFAYAHRAWFAVVAFIAMALIMALATKATRGIGSPGLAPPPVLRGEGEAEYRVIPV